MKMAILAAGGIAGTMASTISRMKEVECYAVASRSLEKAQQFAEKYGFTKAYGSYEEMVQDEEIDLVYIASPHSHHYEHIKLCLEHGKNVLCEKAFTANAKQAREVLKMAEEKGLLLTEAIWVRYMPMVKTIKEVLASGVIGDITTMTSNLHYSIDMNQRIIDPALAGGALLDVGIYALTFASLFMGDDIAEIVSTCTKFDTGVDAQNCMILKYKDGRMAICNSGSGAISDRKGIFYGRKGYVIVENINNFESVSVYDSEHKLIQTINAPAQITGYEYEVLACKEAIENGKTECEECPHEMTIQMMEQMDEIRRQWGIRYPFE